MKKQKRAKKFYKVTKVTKAYKFFLVLFFSANLASKKSQLLWMHPTGTPSDIQLMIYNIWWRLNHKSGDFIWRLFVSNHIRLLLFVFYERHLYADKVFEVALEGLKGSEDFSVMCLYSGGLSRRICASVRKMPAGIFWFGHWLWAVECSPPLGDFSLPRPLRNILLLLHCTKICTTSV